MKKQKISQQDYLKAHRKASREEEIEQHGRPARFRAVHKSKKAYDRKREKAGSSDLPFSFYQEMLASPPRTTAESNLQRVISEISTH
ncbi:MAG: hypothetical protein LUH46_05060 [Alistipes sp.]|nr:hypothetical protein [Alistipes sp.]